MINEKRNDETNTTHNDCILIIFQLRYNNRVYYHIIISILNQSCVVVFGRVTIDFAMMDRIGNRTIQRQWTYYVGN